MSENQHEIKVTFLIASYHASFEKLKRSALSGIIQEGISLEIIVCDDGSDDPHFVELRALFLEHGFTNYVLLGAEKNAGTVKNVLKASDHAHGHYLVAVGAGDYFCHKTVLRDWYQDCITHDAPISFGDIINFRTKNGQDEVLSVPRIPHCLFLYQKTRRHLNTERYAYLLCYDHICGASWMVRTDLFFSYTKLLDDRVIYANDNCFRLMIHDGYSFRYYPKEVMNYEYGDGVSTSSSSTWSTRIQKDMRETDRVLCEMEPKDAFSRRVQRYFRKAESCKSSKERTLLLFLSFPEYVAIWVRNQLGKK